MALVVEHQRRNADTFLIDLRRACVVGSVRGTSDVALVRAVDRPEYEPVPIEDGNERGEIRQVVPAPVGVVQQVDVTRPYPPLEELVHGPRRKRQRADVDRYVLRLGDQPPVGVAERSGEIPARVQDLRVGRSQHCLAHLLDDGTKTMLDHGDGDRINGGVHEMTRSEGGVP